MSLSIVHSAHLCYVWLLWTVMFFFILFFSPSLTSEWSARGGEECHQCPPASLRGRHPSRGHTTGYLYTLAHRHRSCARISITAQISKNNTSTSTFPTVIYLYNLVFDAALFILIPNKQVCQMITSDSKTSQNYCQILPLKLIRWLTGLWFQRKMLSGSCWTQRHGKILNSKISWR